MAARSEIRARRLPLVLIRRALLSAVFAVCGVGAPVAKAQALGPDVGFPLAETLMPTRILVLDQERLFAESQFGRRVATEIDSRSREIAAENRRLEAQLESEERDLTQLRPSLAPAEFRARADAFNAKVQRIRSEQDAKARALASFRESEQQRFLGALGPVLTTLAAEENAVAVMDRRLLLLAAESIDITVTAIERVDLAVGAGETPAPIGESAPLAPNDDLPAANADDQPGAAEQDGRPSGAAQQAPEGAGPDGTAPSFAPALGGIVPPRAPPEGAPEGTENPSLEGGEAAGRLPEADGAAAPQTPPAAAGN